jgi:hypothetical protein
MPERNTIAADNREPVPEGVAGESAGTDLESLPLEELEKLVKGGGEAKVEPAKTEEKAAKEESEKAAVEDTEIPEELLKKSPQELVKELVNLRKLYGKQANELGELRKWKELKEKEEQERELLRLDASSTSLIQLAQKSLEDISDEEKEKFIEEFIENPIAAISKIMQRVMHPVFVNVARLEHEKVIEKLRQKTKDSLVPFEEIEQEVYNYINAQPDGGAALFAQYGSRAFEVAYEECKKRHLEDAYRRKLQQLEEELQHRLQEEQKKRAYTESPIASAGPGQIDYESLPLEELVKLIPGYPKNRLR